MASKVFKQSNKDLSEIRADLEARRKKDFADMAPADRVNFIRDCIRRADNYKTLRNIEYVLTDILRDPDWNDDLIYYLSNIDNAYLDSSIIKLIATLLDDNKIRTPISSDSWLFDKSLYDRSPSDILYTIKALTLADNPKLQKKDGKSYFNAREPLTIKDLYDGDNIVSASRIKDILDNKQVKNYTTNSASEKQKEKDKQRKAEERRKEKELIRKYGDTGVNILQAELAKRGISNMTRDDVKQYLKDLNVIPGNMKPAMDQIIDSDILNPIIGKILKTRYLGTVMQEPIEELNNDLAITLRDQFEKSIGGIK